MGEQIEKIYNLKEIGGEQVLSMLSSINSEFAQIKRTKQSLNKESLKATFNEDSEGVEKLKLQLDKLKLKEGELKIKRQELINQSKKQQLIRQQELSQQRAITNGNSAMAGSYYDIAKRYRELSQIAKNTVNLLDPEEVKSAQRELKVLKDQLDNFSRGLTRDGTLVGEYTSGIIGAFKRLGLDSVIKDQVDTAKAKVKELESEFKKLSDELKQTKSTGTDSFNEIERKMIENRREAEALAGKISNVENELKSTGSVGSQITEGLRSGFKRITSQITQMVIGYLSFQAALTATRKLISANYDLSDKYEDLQRVLEATNEEFTQIEGSIRAIETRTSLKNLFDFAFIAAKAGVAKEEIAGVTKALDQLFVVAGTQLGDPETAFENLVKLNTIFNNGAEVTGENLQKIGNALVELDNKGVASVQFIIDFSKRMTGAKGITDITIGSVLGLGAAFEENGISAEVAGTAVSKILVQLYNDIDKYAKISGMARKEFEKLLNTDPGEALLRVSSGLRGTGQLATEFAESFSELGSEAVRVQMAMGAMASKTEYFRGKITLANNALNDSASIAENAAKKQENFAATVDKIKKSFEFLATSKAAQVTLLAISGLILLIIQNIPTLITLVSLWAAGWAVANKALVLQYSQLVLVNAQLLISRIALGAAAIAQGAYNVMIGLFTGVTTGATAATRLFGLALKSLPLGWLLVILGALVALLVSVTSAFAGTTGALRENALAAKLNADINKELNEQLSGTLSKINALTKVLKDNTISLDARKLALESLISIAPEYLNKLTLENIATSEGKVIIDGYVNSLKNKIKYQAIEAGLQKAQQKLLDAQSNELRSATDEDFAKKQYRSNTNTPFFSSVVDAFKFGTSASEQAVMKKYFQEQGEAAQREIDFFTGKLSTSIVESAKTIGEVTKTEADNSIGARKKQLESQIKTLELGYDTLNRSDLKGQKANIDQRKAFQKELDELNGKEDTPGKPYRGSRIAGETKDLIKVIDEEMDIAKAELEKAKLLGTISEKDYWSQLNTITQTGVNKKLEIIKDGNAEEKKQRASLQLESIKSRLDTADKIFEINSKLAKQDLDQEIQNSQEELNQVLDNINSTGIEKAEAQLKFDQQALIAHKKFNDQMDDLEKTRNEKSKDNAIKRKQDLTAIARKEHNDLVDIAKEKEKAINTEVKSDITNEETDYANKQADIYNRQYLFESQRKRDLEKLEQEHKGNILGIQKAGLTAELQLQKEQRDLGLISETEYKEKSETILESLAGNALNSAKLMFEGLTASWDSFTATLGKIGKAFEEINQRIAQPYFNLQKQRIDNEEKATEKQEEQDKKRLLSQANSTEEREEIEKRYEQKKTENARKFGEQRKQIALKELAIESALAAIKAISTASNIYEGFVMAGLVGIEYLLQRQAIMEQQFEDGGYLRKTLNNGGVFKGRSHKEGGIKFLFGGQGKEVEGKEGYVINKNSMSSQRRMTVTGTPSQIASAANVSGGGIDFAPGAKRMLFQYGGLLGRNLSAPSYPISSYFTQANSMQSGDMNDLKEMYIANMSAIKAVSNQVLNLQVNLNPNSVTDHQNKYAKAVKLGSL